MSLRSESQVLPTADLFFVNDGSPLIADVNLPENTRGLIVNTSGSLDVTINGTDYDAVPFFAGVNPGFWQKVRVGSDDLTIWAIL